MRGGGKRLSTAISNRVWNRLEEKIIRTSELRPESYDRYVDDCLMVWQHVEENLLKIIGPCNHQHTNIPFTWESTASKKPVSFMGLMIRIGADQRL